MQGQYTEDEMKAMVEKGDVIKQTFEHIIIRISCTYNYYQKCSDGSWLNYDCKTRG